MSEARLNPSWERRGRPPEGDDALFQRLNIRIPGEMMRMIDEISSTRIDKPAKARVVRELLAIALSRVDLSRIEKD